MLDISKCIPYWRLRNNYGKHSDVSHKISVVIKDGISFETFNYSLQSNLKGSHTFSPPDIRHASNNKIIS